jgi:hypothetical protein
VICLRRFVNFIWRTTTQKHKTRHEGRGRCPDKRGISRYLAVLIFPENLNRCKPFLATAVLCLNRLDLRAGCSATRTEELCLFKLLKLAYPRICARAAKNFSATDARAASTATPKSASWPRPNIRVTRGHLGPRAAKCCLISMLRKRAFAQQFALRLGTLGLSCLRKSVAYATGFSGLFQEDSVVTPTTPRPEATAAPRNAPRVRSHRG